jgi:hypothetical protein
MGLRSGQRIHDGCLGGCAISDLCSDRSRHLTPGVLKYGMMKQTIPVS